MRRKNAFIIFIVLTIINVLIFIFRDAFLYQPYADYNSLYQPCDSDCILKWKQITNDYPSTEITEARKITDSVVKGKNTIDKITSIGNLLVSRFLQQLGNPTEQLRRSSPLIQYKMLTASDTEQLWCGNFGQMFSLFCWSQGITTRTIEIMYPNDHHILNECYVPEIKKWVMVDLTSNFILTMDQNNFLDFISFRKKVSQNADLSFIGSVNNSPEKENLEKSRIPRQYFGNYPACYYHLMDEKKVYSKSSKIKRYFLPVSWYDIFDDKKHSNLAFYLKEVFSFLWLVSFFVFLYSRLKFKA